MEAEAPVIGPYGYTDRARRWFDKHPHFETDPVYRAAAMAIHADLWAKGITEKVSADLYYEMLNAGLKQRFGKKHGRGRPSKERR